MAVAADLAPGLVLTKLQGIKVSGLQYQPALDLLKAADRPLHLTFVSQNSEVCAHQSNARTMKRARKLQPPPARLRWQHGDACA